MLQVRQLSLTNVIFYFNKLYPCNKLTKTKTKNYFSMLYLLLVTRTKIPTVNLKTTKNN